MSCIEDLREKREELNRSLLRDEEEKAKIQKELSTLTERLSRLNEDIARKMQARVEFDQTVRGMRQGWLHAHATGGSAATAACATCFYTGAFLLAHCRFASSLLMLTPPFYFSLYPTNSLHHPQIQETEAAYMKILESSQTLLSVLKRESVNLTKRKTATS